MSTPETPSQLKDLAGNMMSCTVIAMAPIVALIICQEVFLMKPNDLEDIDFGLEWPAKDIELGYTVRFDYNVHAHYDLVALRTFAESNNCVCNYNSLTTPGALAQCSACQELACSRCSGDLIHAGLLNLGLPRQQPEDFKLMVENALLFNLNLHFETNPFKGLQAQARKTLEYQKYTNFFSIISFTNGKICYNHSRWSIYWAVINKMLFQMLQLAFRHERR